MNWIKELTTEISLYVIFQSQFYVYEWKNGFLRDFWDFYILNYYSQ